MNQLESWGRYPKATHDVVPLHWRGDDPFARAAGRPVLAYGQGRSYGDTCLNDRGVLLTTRGLDRFIALDEERGVLTCEAGVTLADILALVVPRGLFLPTVPGTRFVSVGGAIANDIHGKNHHRHGTFGRNVLSLELLRSDGRRLRVSREQHPDLFAATIGGLGLTGLILSAEIQLRRVPSPFLDKETVPFSGLDAFFDVAARSDEGFEYTVAWVDCVARGRKLGRGLFYRANHVAAPGGGAQPRTSGGPRVPFDLPSWTLNHLTVGLFNVAYYTKNRMAGLRRTVHYDPFFFPLDGVREWNRIYGRDGLLQFQCVVPRETARDSLRALLELIARSGSASFLAVLKAFGDLPSPGMLSFPRPGFTLALDFAHRGERTLRLYDELVRITRDAGGAIYPAKDARMAASDMASFYPRLPEFRRHLDPAFSSSFWRRVAP